MILHTCHIWHGLRSSPPLLHTVALTFFINVSTMTMFMNSQHMYMHIASRQLTMCTLHQCQPDLPLYVGCIYASMCNSGAKLQVSRRESQGPCSWSALRSDHTTGWATFTLLVTNFTTTSSWCRSLHYTCTSDVASACKRSAVCTTIISGTPCPH